MMRCSRTVRRVAAALLAAIALVAGPGSAQGPEAVPLPEDGMTGLRLPMEYREDGSVRSQLMAGRARLLEGQDVEATGGVRVEFLAPGGEVEMSVETPACHFDRQRELVKSDDVITMDRPDVTIRGRGFEWNKKGQFVLLKNDVEVTLGKGLQLRADGISVVPDTKGKK